MSSGFQLVGLFGVLPTAFDDEGALDLDSVASLVQAQIDAGAAGSTVLGVMGEAAELSEAERDQVLACVLATSGTSPVIVGISGPSAEIVSTRAKDAAAKGVTAVMVSPSTTLGLADAIAAAAEGGLPIVVQDYPQGSGVRVTAEEIAAVVAAQPLIVGVKAEAPPTSDAIARFKRDAPSLGVMGGLGGLFLIDELRAGATGVMTGFAMPDRLARIIAAFPEDPAEAQTIWEGGLPVMRFEAFQPFSLAARKEVWRLQGVIRSSFCRRIGASLDGVSRADIRRAYEQVAGSA
ncbi:MAG: dihydrodipicolinate synthase family protein [Candidatus Limnocylindrales bacterium]